MDTVMTVLGPVSRHALGFTSMHEHVLTNCSFYMADMCSAVGTPPDNAFPMDPDSPIELQHAGYLQSGYFVHHKEAWDLSSEELMQAEVADFARAGGGAMLECSAPGIRVNVPGLARISAATGVHIVASTGLYAEKSWPEHFLTMDGKGYEAYVLDEIRNGMDGTDIRPGQIKVASNENTERQLRFIRAAARACAATNYLVTIHIGIDMNHVHAREIVRLMLANGASPDRLLLCHFQNHTHITGLQKLHDNPHLWQPQLDFAAEVLDQGINICFDCFGQNWAFEPCGKITEPDGHKVTTIAKLIERGYGGQIVVGADVFLRIMTRRFGGHGYVRLLNYVVPSLRHLSTSEAEIRKLTIDNPGRMLAFE